MFGIYILFDYYVNYCSNSLFSRAEYLSVFILGLMFTNVYKHLQKFQEKKAATKGMECQRELEQMQRELTEVPNRLSEFYLVCIV
tara:strand:+ start:384 stop:638 length:255 start_codon:yes stop_codon:yes gene_type:complete